jgi:hypothetical protein
VGRVLRLWHRHSVTGIGGTGTGGTGIEGTGIGGTGIGAPASGHRQERFAK